MSAKYDLNTMAALGNLFEGTMFDKVFKETFTKTFAELKETTDGITAFQKANAAATAQSIRFLPLLMRINYLLNSLVKIDEAKNEDVGDIDPLVDWNFINQILTDNIEPSDYNCGERKVNSVEELKQYKIDIELALSDIQPWIIRKCKECGEDFTIFFSEAEYFNGKDMQLPKRCKKCRKARKEAANKKIDDSHQALAELVNRDLENIKKLEMDIEKSIKEAKEERQKFGTSSMVDALKKAGF